MGERVGPAEPPTGGGPAAARLRPLRSVRVRITLAAALVTAVAIATAGWLQVRSVEESQLGAIRDDTEDLLDRVTERLAAGVPPERTLRPRELTSSFVEMVYEDGTSIKFVPTYYLSGGASDEFGIRTFTEGPGAEPAPSDGIGPDSPTPTMRMPIVSARTVDTPAGEVTVTVAAPIDEVARSLDAVRRALTIGFPVLVGLVALAAWWIVGRALRPVELIRAEADAISASTLHRRVPEPGTGDEVHRLSRTMNAMLERLEGAVRRQRQFVADASHELRNPVAGIRTDVEVALCEPDRADWLQVAHGVLAAEARLETLIDDLLVLAAEDEGAAALPTTEVDLTELATTEARRSRKVPVISATGPDGVVVAGSHSQLRRALANLVDNAERHARSQVRIGTTGQAGWVQLWVDDDGPGISPADRDRVFERFTRLDDGRGRDEGGFGLGLAVVRSIVARHRGGVWTEDSPLGGARFVIALPAADPSDPSYPSDPSPRPRPERNGGALHQNRPTTPRP